MYLALVLPVQRGPWDVSLNFSTRGQQSTVPSTPSLGRRGWSLVQYRRIKTCGLKGNAPTGAEPPPTSCYHPPYKHGPERWRPIERCFLSSSPSLRAFPPHLLPVTNNDTKFDFALCLHLSLRMEVRRRATSHQVLGMILEFRRGQSGLIVIYTSTRRGTFPDSSITLACSDDIR